jgi:hypothetical protein
MRGILISDVEKKQSLVPKIAEGDFGDDLWNLD